MADISKKVITIGTFDGLHIGHKKILKKVISIAQEKNLEPAVLTLFPHPRMVLQKDSDIKLLNTINERISNIKTLGISNVVVKTFNTSFANLSAEAYVKQVLVDELNAKTIVIGYDHHFGKNRSANITDLKQFSPRYGFNVIEISAQDIEDITVSSTKIRKALDQGQISLANQLLGYPYYLTGEVVKGNSIGRTLNFPTANIHIPEDYKLIPKDGVYVVKATIKSKEYYGMMNIGHKPTLNAKRRSVEVHFFNFNHDLYGDVLKVEILERLREEQKFQDLEKLKQQLEQDKLDALDYLEHHYE